MPRSSPPSSPPDDATRQQMREQYGLAWHPTGGWCKRLPGERNRTYFGKVPAADAVKALHRLEDQREAGALADAAIEARMHALDVGEAVNAFLNHADRQHKAGKISDEQRASYGDELERFALAVGKKAKLADLCKMTAPEQVFRPLRETAMSRGIFAAEKHVTQVRTFLDWCSRVRRFCPPPFYADAFDPPGEKEKRAAKKAVRRHKGHASWTPVEAREIVAAAKAVDVHRYAWVLLMLNGGMGATDLSLLEDADVDWERACIHTDRSKTLVPRVVPLWTETLDAMKASRAVRAKPVDPAHATRFFLTPKGLPLVTKGLSADRKKTRGSDAVRNFFYHLLNPPKGEREKKGRPRLPDLSKLKKHRAGAYTLRSCFVTFSAGESAELVAVILGHKFGNPVTEFYLRGDLLSRLRHVVDRVHAEVWPTSSGNSVEQPPPPRELRTSKPR